MLGMHWEVLLPLVLLAMLLFGAKRLPEMGSAVGQTIKEFQKSIRDKDPVAEPPALPASADTVAPRE